MLKVTKFTDYALVVLCCMATSTNSASHSVAVVNTNTGTASNSASVMSATSIAKAVNLQLPTVSKILKILVNSGLVKSFRGADGGYALARGAEFITVSQVIASVEGPVALTDCTSLTVDSSCQYFDNCQLRRPWQKINSGISRMLNNISINDIVNDQINFSTT